MWRPIGGEGGEFYVSIGSVLTEDVKCDTEESWNSKRCIWYYEERDGKQEAVDKNRRKCGCGEG